MKVLSRALPVAVSLTIIGTPLLATPVSYSLRSARVHNEVTDLHGLPPRIEENNKIIRDGYLSYLVDFHLFLKYLEKQIAETDDPVLKKVQALDLARSERIASDIKKIGRRATIPEPSAGAKEYVEYLETIAEEPHRLLAHTWLAYDHLLHTGAIVGRKVGRELRVNLDALSMYRYSTKPRQLRVDLRRLVDGADLTNRQRHHIIDEEMPTALEMLSNLLLDPTTNE